MHDLLEQRGFGMSGWQRDIQVASELNFNLNDFNWVSSASRKACELAAEQFDRAKLADQLELVLKFCVDDSS